MRLSFTPIDIVAEAQPDAMATKSESSTLEALLAARSDVTLVFSEDYSVPAHSLILRQWSGVLGSLLDSCGNSSTGSCSDAADISIPIEGTSKEDWLTVMAFLYPVVPQPVVSWDNLQVRPGTWLLYCNRGSCKFACAKTMLNACMMDDASP